MILTLLAEHGCTPKKVATTKGGEYACACPRCGGKDRFRCWPAQSNGEGTWFCRGCNKGGDAIAFLMEFDGMDFREAAVRVGRDVGGYVQPAVRTPRPPKASTPSKLKANEVTDPDVLWRQKAGKLVDHAHQALLNNPGQMVWLKERGISDITVHWFKLGWIESNDGDDLFRPRESWGLPMIVKDNGRKKMLWIPRGLVIPKFSLCGEVERIRIRRPEGDPRYYIMPGGAADPQPMLYIPSTWPGPHTALVIVETELDAMLIAQESRDLVSVLALGSALAKPKDPEAVALVKNAAWIGLAQDRDRAGDQAVAWWKSVYPDSRDIRPDGVKDPGDLAKASGSIREWILSAVPPAWRVGRKYEKKEGANSPSVPAGVSRSVNRLKQLLDQVDQVVMMLKDDNAGNVNIYGLDDAGNRDKAWQFHPAGREIIDLFLWDEDVDAYLSRHPARSVGICSDNYWEGLR